MGYHPDNYWNNNRRNSDKKNIFQMKKIKKNWGSVYSFLSRPAVLILLVIPILIFSIIMVVKKLQKKNAENKAQILQQEIQQTTGTTHNFKKDAQLLYNLMGYSSGWLTGWLHQGLANIQHGDEIRAILNKYDRKSYTGLDLMYFQLYQRNLHDDLNYAIDTRPYKNLWI